MFYLDQFCILDEEAHPFVTFVSGERMGFLLLCSATDGPLLTFNRQNNYIEALLIEKRIAIRSFFLCLNISRFHMEDPKGPVELTNEGNIALISCPSCNKKTVGDGDRCAECKTEFPWMNQIHQRETAVIRATYNVITDLYESIATGRKPNKHKIMGLLNAMLVGRIVILLGSLIGAVFVVIQIYYLYRQTEIIDNQNRLIEQQTSFMKFEQLSRIRELFKEDNTKKAILEYNLTNGPSEANIAIVKNLVKGDVDAINTIFPVLLQDKDPDVRIGALKVLTSFDSLVRDSQALSISLEGCQIDDLDFAGLPIKQFFFNDCVLNRCKFSSTTNFIFITQQTCIINSSLIGQPSRLISVSVSNTLAHNFYVTGSRFEKLNFNYTLADNLTIRVEENPVKFRYSKSTDDLTYITAQPRGSDDTASVDTLNARYKFQISERPAVMLFWGDYYPTHYARVLKLSPFLNLIPWFDEDKLAN